MADDAVRACSRSWAWRREHWREHVRAWSESGETVAAYCRRHGLDRKSLYRWRRALRECGEAPGASGVGGQGLVSRGPVFAEVRVRGCEAESSGAIEVVLAGARRVRVHPGFDAETLGRVVRVLEGEGC